MTEPVALWRASLRSIGIALALAVSLALTAFAPNVATAQDPTETDASVRFVHASPDAPPVDVIVDGAVAASNLAFGQATDFLAVSPNEHQVQIVPSGSDASSAVIDTTFDPEGGSNYIVAASGLLADIEAKIYDVHKDDLDTGKSRLRLINLSPDDANVDLFATGGDELFDDLEFGEASDYTDLDAGTYDFEVRQHDSETVALAIPGFGVGDGNAYDVLLLGQSSDSTLTVLSLATPVDTPCSEVLGVGTPSDACVRVIHASPDAPAVDIYVNDSPIIEGLAFGASTDFVALPSGDDREVKIVPAGNPVDDALTTSQFDLDAGNAYEVIALNMLEDLNVEIEDVDLTAVPDGQARMRVIHGAPDVDGVDVIVTDGPELFGGVAFQDVSDYETLDAGDYDLQVKQGDDVLIRVTDFAVDPGMVYDVIVIGRNDDGSLALIAVSAPTQPATGAASTPDTSSTPVMVEEATPEIIATPAG
ncbi:MAG: DUF4397 domain-containing protein [Thermomicrobiales bacterium]|nr:DUF4397 domain-containing protein [Thermomicrobiales bacterium]MCO5222064.1 DUF4397 domain-containing protein [Thermomicrobiales bacterium]